GAGSLLVLDDLPRMAGDEPFSQRLTLLARASREEGCNILSTSQRMLPLRVQSEAGEEVILERPVPLFSEAEAHELFLAHGAPADRLPDRTVRFARDVTGGHPLLLALAAEFLSEHGWDLRDEEFDALLRGAHAERAQAETLARLAERLGEPQRELL